MHAGMLYKQGSMGASLVAEALRQEIAAQLAAAPAAAATDDGRGSVRSAGHTLTLTLPAAAPEPRQRQQTQDELTRRGHPAPASCAQPQPAVPADLGSSRYSSSSRPHSSSSSRSSQGCGGQGRMLPRAAAAVLPPLAWCSCRPRRRGAAPTSASASRTKCVAQLVRLEWIRA